MSKRKPRRKGEGSVYELPDKQRWRGTIELGSGPGGKRRRKTVTRKTEREVVAALRRLQRQYEDGVNLMPERQTVEAFLRRWLADVARLKVRPITVLNYERVLTWYVLPSIGAVQLQKLTPQHIQAMIGALASQGLAPATIQSARAILSSALKLAVTWRLIPVNPAAATIAPRDNPSRARALTPEQARAVLQAVRGDKWEAAYVILLLLGLRRGEVLGLRWEDIDMGAGTIRVVQSLTLLAGKPHLSQPKTASAVRALPMPALVREALGVVGAGLVFTTEHGQPIHPDSLLHHFQVLLRRAGLPHMRLHDLRHSCATLLAASNVPPRVTQEILGHKNITTTLAVYTQVYDASRRAAVDTMDSLLGGDDRTDG